MKMDRVISIILIILLSATVIGCGSVGQVNPTESIVTDVKAEETAAAQIMDIAENAKSITVTNAYEEYSDDYIYTDDEKIKTILDFMRSFDLTEADEIPEGTGGDWRLTIIDGEEKEISASFETVMHADYIRANDRVWKIPDGTRARFIKLIRELSPDGNLEAWESYWDSYLKDADQ